MVKSEHWYGHVLRREDGYVLRREDGHVLRREDGHVLRREDSHVLRREDGHVLRREDGHEDGVLCQLKCILGNNHIATRLRLIWQYPFVWETVRF